MRWYITFLLASATTFSAANAKATLIDSFDGVGRSYTVSCHDRYDSGHANPGSSVATGGYRDASLQWISGGSSRLTVDANDDSQLRFVEGDGTAIAQIVWDAGPGNRRNAFQPDLTTGGNDRFVLDIPEVTGTGFALSMIVYSSAGRMSTFTTLLTPGPYQELAIPYDSFLALGPHGADFSHVGAIVMTLVGRGCAGSASSGVVIDDIRTATSSSLNSVPEPSTLAMAAIGLAGLLALRRRRLRAL